MAQNSKIEWTEATWNPVTGCLKISEGCLNCYAERLALRLQAMGNKRYRKGFSINLHRDLLDLPLKWKKSKIIFVNSMSDLFHEDVPMTFILKVFETIGSAYWHNFQILTKRSKRLARIASKLTWPSNLWVGVTIESNKYLDRLADLKTVPASVKFISMEPLLSNIPKISLKGIDWVIVGGESGPKCRIMKREWVQTVRELCIKNQVPFFFKQWGGTNKSKNGRLLDGRIWNEIPKDRIKLLV